MDHTDSPGRGAEVRSPLVETKSTGVGYLLLGLSLFGAAGIHRFYLGRPISGLLYFFTFGVFGIGTVVDLFLLPRMVEEENIRLGFRSLPPGFFQQNKALPAPSSPPQRARGVAPPPPSPEQAVLRLAKANEGRVTVAMVAVDTGMPLRRVKRTLEQLVKDGYAERDVSTEGAGLYVFPGLRSNQIFDIDDL